jgi:hypothetical protein
MNPNEMMGNMGSGAIPIARMIEKPKASSKPMGKPMGMKTAGTKTGPMAARPPQNAMNSTVTPKGMKGPRK